MSDDTPDLLRILNAHRIPFLIVGAHALAFHGYSRPTRDLDIFLDPASNPIPALIAFGIPNLSAFPPASIIRFGTHPNRIDLTNVIEGLAFPAAWPNRILATFAGIPAHFPSLPDLTSAKLASHRIKDHLDGLHLLGIQWAGESNRGESPSRRQPA